ncbi:methyltransferase type 11 [Pseudomonas sp. WN033]|nr:methyltransferase type 11 [Pseudomonas sp. WN033]
MKRADSTFVPALGFHRLTPLYDAVVGLTTREKRVKQALIAQAGLAPGLEVLDLACGTGTLAVWVKRQYPRLSMSAVDADPAILTLARRKADKAGISVDFAQAMSQALPYANSRFDRVLSSLFFHHLSWEVKQRTARELFRIIKPGGQLHVADWGKPENPLMRSLFLFIQLLDGFDNTGDNLAGRLVPLFEAAGFVEVTQARTFNTLFGTMALYSAVKPG